MPIFTFIGYTLTELFRKSDNWRQIYKQASSTFYTSKVCHSKTRWQEKIFRTSKQRHFLKNLLRFTPLRNSCLITFKKSQKQPPEKFCKKAILKNFAIFTGKHLCWRLFLIQNIAKYFTVPILKNIWERLLLKMFMKLRKVKYCW